MKTRPRQQLVFTLLLSLMLGGCGFQLKGSQTAGNATLAGETVTLASSQPRSELTAALSQQLRLAGVNLDAEQSGLLLKLGPETFHQRNLSLTAQARSAEVELTMSSRIALSRGDKTLIAPTQATVVRQFLNDPRNVVGKTEELRLLRDEMRIDLAAQIVRRIGHSLGN